MNCLGVQTASGYQMWLTGLVPNTPTCTISLCSAQPCLPHTRDVCLPQYHAEYVCMNSHASFSPILLAHTCDVPQAAQ